MLGLLLTRLTPAAVPPPPPDHTLATTMEALLQRSFELRATSGCQELYERLLGQLVADEARILAALSDGSGAPLVHVRSRGRGRLLLENASLIGRTAALTLPRMTPVYIGRLRRLELVEVGPQATALNVDYEVLLAERGVRLALKAGELGKLPARVERRTLRLAPLGRELWAACQPAAG
jgi:hypothetical protein